MGPRVRKPFDSVSETRWFLSQGPHDPRIRVPLKRGKLTSEMSTANENLAFKLSWGYLLTIDGNNFRSTDTRTSEKMKFL